MVIFHSFLYVYQRVTFCIFQIGLGSTSRNLGLPQLISSVSIPWGLDILSNLPKDEVPMGRGPVMVLPIRTGTGHKLCGSGVSDSEHVWFLLPHTLPRSNPSSFVVPWSCFHLTMALKSHGFRRARWVTVPHLPHKTDLKMWSAAEQDGYFVLWERINFVPPEVCNTFIYLPIDLFC